MSRVVYKCEKCGKTINVNFKAGEKPENPTCEKCSKKMTRQFKSPQLGDVVSDTMIDLGQKMLYQ